MCARWGAALRPSSRSRKGSGDSTARSRRTWPAGWRYGKIVRAYVKRLRTRLGDDADRPAWIFNERGVGYRMARPGEAGEP